MKSITTTRQLFFVLLSILIATVLIGLTCNTLKASTDVPTRTVQFYCDIEYYAVEIPAELPDFMNFRAKVAPIGTSLLKVQFLDPNVSTNRYVLICSQKIGECPGLVGLMGIKGSKVTYWTYIKGWPFEAAVKEFAKHIQDYRINREN